MTYDRFDLFEAYTNQTLPDSERQALENQLRTDASLRAELRDYQQFKHSLDAVKLKEQLERIHNRLDRQGVLDRTDRPPQPLKSASALRRQRLVWPIIAALLLVGGVYWLTRPSHTEQIYVTYYQPEPVARGETICAPDLMPGLQTYRAGQYEKALNQFMDLPASQPCVSYYVGLAQLALNQPTLAIRAFESTLKPGITPPPLIRQKAEWYLALAYLKADQPNEAQQQLSLVAQQPDQPFRTVARKVLADLKND